MQLDDVHSVRKWQKSVTHWTRCSFNWATKLKQESANPKKQQKNTHTKKHISVIDCLSLTSSLYMYPLTLTFTSKMSVTLMERCDGNRHSCNSHSRKRLFTLVYYWRTQSNTKRENIKICRKLHILMRLYIHNHPQHLFYKDNETMICSTFSQV